MKTAFPLYPQQLDTSLQPLLSHRYASARLEATGDWAAPPFCFPSHSLGGVLARTKGVFLGFFYSQKSVTFLGGRYHTHRHATHHGHYFLGNYLTALLFLFLSHAGKGNQKRKRRKISTELEREEETTRLTTHFYFIFGMAEWLTSKHEQKKKHPRTFGVAAKTKKKDKQETLIAPLLRERKVGFPIFTSSFFSGTTFWHSAILFSTPAYPIPVASQPSNILREEDLFFSKPRARVFGFFFWFGAAESVRPSLRARGYPRSGQHHFFSFENSTSKIVLFSLRDFFLCRVEFKWNDPPTIEQHENVLFSFFFIICPLPTSKRRLFCRLLHMLSLG